MGQNEDVKYPICVQESYGVTHRRLYQLIPTKDDKLLQCTIKDVSKQWQSLTSFFMAFASSISGSLCTHAVLKGVGVGDESASVLSATITWLIKDGTAMIGRIVFAWLKGTKLDCDCKKWRLFADILNDIAMLMDISSQYFPHHFTVIISVSGIFKSIVGVAGGSTRAALTQHQARHNNMADVSAKDGSQETLVNLLALAFSLVMIPIVTKSLFLTWVVFGAMTTVHLTSNYFAVRSVVMETFNSARFKIFTRHYLEDGITHRNFLSVNEVNQRENVFFSFHPKKVTINLGTSFQNIIKNKRCEYVEKLLTLYKDCDYLLSVNKKNNSTIINIALGNKSSVKTEMEALYQSCFVEHLMENLHLSKHWMMLIFIWKLLQEIILQKRLVISYLL
ncbi:RUS family member 1-like isoform X2 [Uloborus diversus]|uniref:RUS family member 1-like isoform X2 n=1 Tax=Uloborus diversus TaxID=327109 RepID=UPI00240A572F|nr:RUS family member 1-like isoform X2 [Uloborus diversus]